MLSVFCFIIVTFQGLVGTIPRSRGPVAEMPPTNAKILSDCQKMIIVPPITNLLSPKRPSAPSLGEVCRNTRCKLDTQSGP